MMIKSHTQNYVYCYESHFNETSIHALHLISKNDKLMQAFSRNKMHEMGY